MNWNLRNDLPIYPQLIYEIKCAIVSGELEPGSRLQGVREMSLDAKVNPNTMQRAMSELEREGLVYTQRTNGRFVTDDQSVVDNLKSSLARENIDNFIKTMNRIGIGRKEVVEYLKKYKEEDE